MKAERILSEEAIRVLKDLRQNGVRLSTGVIGECWTINGPSLGVREVGREAAEALVNYGLVRPTIDLQSYKEYCTDALFPEDAIDSEKDPNFDLHGHYDDSDYVKYVMSAIDNAPYYGARGIRVPNGMSAAAQQVIIDLGYKIEDGRISWQPNAVEPEFPEPHWHFDGVCWLFAASYYDAETDVHHEVSVDARGEIPQSWEVSYMRGFLSDLNNITVLEEKWGTPMNAAKAAWAYLKASVLAERAAMNQQPSEPDNV